MMRAKVLIVDDDFDIVQGLQKRLQWMGHDVLVAEDGERALALSRREIPDIIMLDIEIPGLSGLDVLKHLANYHRQTMNLSGSHYAMPCVIVMTAFGTIGRAVEAMKLGAFDFLTKPFDGDHLAMVIEKALTIARPEWCAPQSQKERDSPYGRSVGLSSKWQVVEEMARQAAAFPVTVLLQGETGTGKEVVARAIHRLSERAGGPFMVINCAALPETLLENELYGHEKGAFTGAVLREIGKLEAADGGSVFLDEIGDMPPCVQAKFLRVLQDREFYRIGGTRLVHTDVRFIAATNKDLKAAASDGRFREDLYYRLAVVTIALPPLRDRIEDLADLTTGILQRGARLLGRPAVTIHAAAIDALKRYCWPGNVRELENALMRAMILSVGQELNTTHLLLPTTAASGTDDSRPTGLTYHEAMEQSSKELILKALHRTGWNQTKAAELLGLNRTHLTKLLKQKGIPTKAPYPLTQLGDS